jgi:hypothetical protein
MWQSQQCRCWNCVAKAPCCPPHKKINRLLAATGDISEVLAWRLKACFDWVVECYHSDASNRSIFFDGL